MGGRGEGGEGGEGGETLPGLALKYRQWSLVKKAQPGEGGVRGGGI